MVFESSARLALLARSMPQLVSSLNGLVPGLYTAVGDARSDRGMARHSPSPDTVADSLGRLRLAADGDNRATFASLLLLYHLIQSDSRQQYHSLLLDLSSSPTRRSLRRPFDQTVIRSSESSKVSQSFVTRTQLGFVIKAAGSLAIESFNPLLYSNLLHDTTASPYERHVLSWAQDSVRERTWALIRKAYLSTDLAWAGRLLGYAQSEIEHASWEKGIKVEDGRLKLR